MNAENISDSEYNIGKLSYHLGISLLPLLLVSATALMTMDRVHAMKSIGAVAYIAGFLSQILSFCLGFLAIVFNRSRNKAIFGITISIMYFAYIFIVIIYNGPEPHRYN